MVRTVDFGPGRAPLRFYTAKTLMRHCPSAQEPRLNSHSARPRTYCFICGVALLAGVNFEPLWVRFTEIMYILWCRVP